MITEDYVSYDTAKLLKEKGFDESTIMRYDSNGEISSDGRYGHYNSLKKFDFISAPTLQMAMKWLREVHHLHIAIEMGFDIDNHQYFFYAPSICKFSNKTGENNTPFGEEEFDTYEQACEAVIKYCLENLI